MDIAQALSFNNEMMLKIKKEVAKEKHKETERWRRFRINHQYELLRLILQAELVKKDKASVLEATIKHVKGMRNELEEIWGDGGSSSSNQCVFPAMQNELRVRYCKGKETRLVKVMFSCNDQKNLMSNAATAVKSVNGKVLRSEMVTMGGRTKCALWVQGIKGDKQLHLLKKALNDVIEDPAEANYKAKFASALSSSSWCL